MMLFDSSIGAPDVGVLEGAIRPCAGVEVRQVRFRDGFDSAIAFCVTIASRAGEPYAARGTIGTRAIDCRCAAASGGGEDKGSGDLSSKCPGLAGTRDANSAVGVGGVARIG